MFQLKRYQDETLKALSDFLVAARSGPVADAFAHTLQDRNMIEVPYRHYDFGEVPYVCLRLPTGGGKTVLASHAVVTAARDYLEDDFPIVLWLVPTNTIREQTLEALKTPGHPYRQELERRFGTERLRVMDIGEVNAQVRKQDVGTKAIIVVGTVASLRVDDTSGRKVYAYHEDFEPHFAGVDPEDTRLERVGERDLKENGLGRESLGRIKYSFANLLALHGPMVIMDEAHNARTALTFETLKRIHPRCVIEFTATPDQRNASASNVLYHVSAAQLKAEQMIKLPVMLTEHQDWQAAVRDAVLNRQKLEDDARADADYIRPILLLQAENKNGEVTVDVLKQHLIDELEIDEQAIAIATGTQKELTGIDLTARDCPITCIITMEALKEGWDCPFAYVFCSVKDVRSGRDAEQLLGRVLRMPYARRRQVDSLNRAYAHLASSHFSQAAQMLTDKLINMGFEALEVAANLQQGWSADLFGGGGGGGEARKLPTYEVELPDEAEIPDGLLDGDDEAEENTASITFSQTQSGKKTLAVSGPISEEKAKLIERLFKGAEKKRVKAGIEQHNLRHRVSKSPAQQGVPFAPLPQLCLSLNGASELLEPEGFLYVGGEFSLLDFPAELPQFAISETETTFAVDVDGTKLSYKVEEEKGIYRLNEVDAGFTENGLVQQLERETRHPNVPPLQMNQFLVRLVAYLIEARGFSLTALVRAKYPLARAIRGQIEQYREQAAKRGFQQLLFDDMQTEHGTLAARLDQRYQFLADRYPAKPPYYQGRFQFAKHYYPIIEDLKAAGEEFECAKAIDANSEVKHWVRNLVRQPAASFRLPLADGWFYPDFIAELNDGRLLVVEYKGAAYATNDDSREKKRIGEAWAAASGGQCLFLFALESEGGKNVYQQVADVITKCV